MNVTFGVQDFQDLLRLLEQHPEWRLELRRLVLAEDLLELPKVMRELAEDVRRLAQAQAATEARLEALTHRVEALAQARAATEASLEAVTRRVDALTARVDALAEAQRRTELQLRQFMEASERRFSAIERRLDEMSVDLGYLKASDLERQYRERAAAYFGRLLERIEVLTSQELAVLVDRALEAGQISEDEREAALRADLVVRGRLRPAGKEAYLVVEVSWGVGSDDVERAAAAAAVLGKVVGPALAAVAGRSITSQAQALAESLGVICVRDGRVESDLNRAAPV